MALRHHLLAVQTAYRSFRLALVGCSSNHPTFVGLVDKELDLVALDYCH